MRKLFHFESQHIADSVQIGDILTETSAEFEYSADGRFVRTNKVSKFFNVKRREDLYIVPSDPTKSRNGGDYYYYAYEVVESNADIILLVTWSDGTQTIKEFSSEEEKENFIESLDPQVFTREISKDSIEYTTPYKVSVR